MKQFQGALKGAAGFAGRKTGISGFIDQRKASVAARDKNRGQQLHAKLATGKGFSRFVAGVDEKQAKATKATLIENIAKESLVGKEDPVSLREHAMKNKGSLEGEAAVWKAANSGILDTGDSDFMVHVAHMAANDPVLASTIQKNQKEAWNAMYGHIAASEDAATQALLNENSAEGKALGLKGKADRTIAGTAPADMKSEQFEYLAKHDQARLAQLFKDEAGIAQLMERGNMKQKAAFGQAVRYAEEHRAEPEFANSVAALNSAGSAAGPHGHNIASAYHEAEAWEKRDLEVNTSKGTPEKAKPIWK